MSMQLTLRNAVTEHGRFLLKHPVCRCKLHRYHKLSLVQFRMAGESNTQIRTVSWTLSPSSLVLTKVLEKRIIASIFDSEDGERKLPRNNGKPLSGYTVS
jgi:hypothetical protein